MSHASGARALSNRNRLQGEPRMERENLRKVSSASFSALLATIHTKAARGRPGAGEIISLATPLNDSFHVSSLREAAPHTLGASN